MTAELPYGHRLLIVQPYIPDYRVPFFRELRTALREVDVQLAVAAVGASGDQGLRADDVTAQEGDYRLHERSLSIGSRRVKYRRVGAAIREFRPDLIVVEQAVKNVEGWNLILKSTMGIGPRIGMWGQGRSYSTQQSRVEAEAKQWLTRRSDWFFAYTHGGADFVASHGFPKDRISVLQNSTDTRRLRRDLVTLSSLEITSFVQQHDLTPGRVGLFLGGVDEHKGIRFLLEAARECASRLPGFRLLVGGAGGLAPLVMSAQEAGEPVVYLGRVAGKEKALAMTVADIMMIPEWVGLVAVDALAAGLPILTTNCPSHSPESEYLSPGLTAVFTDHNPVEYAHQSVHLMERPEELKRMSHECTSRSRDLTVENMANRFSSGVRSWVGRRG